MAPEKEISLGEFLRHERERRGITIEQVASATKVGVRTLHALEADHFAELPATPFIRGFVTSYCRFIGLDAKEILSQYESFIIAKATERPNRESGHSGYVFEKKDGEQQSRTILLIAMCSFILLGGIAVLVLKPSLHRHRGSHIDRLRSAHTNPNPNPSQDVSALTIPAAPSSIPASIGGGTSQKPEPSSTPTPASTLVATVPASKPTPVSSPSRVPEEKAEDKKSNTDTATNAAGTNPDDRLDSGHDLAIAQVHHKVILRTLGDIWVRYQVDKRPVRRFIIRKGRTLILKATDQIVLQVSNPKFATLGYNARSSKGMDTIPEAVMKQGTITVFFPTELAETIEKPFDHVQPLPVYVEPKPEVSGQVPPPTP